MTDIIERAEAQLNHYQRCKVYGVDPAGPYPYEVMDALVAELKAARAENERLRKLYDSMSDGYERKYEGFG